MLRRQFLFTTTAGLLNAAPRSQMLLAANTAMLGFSLTDAVKACRDLGFPAIEIQPMGVPQATPNKFPGFAFDQFPEAGRLALKQQLRGFDRITTHLPYTGLNWMSPDPEHKRRSISAVEEAMRATGYFGASAAVLHAQVLSDNPNGDPPLPNEYLDRIRGWGDLARKLGFRIAAETGYPRSVAGFTNFFQALNHPNIGATLDVGHQKSYRELTARVKPDQKGSPEGIRAYNDINNQLVEQLGPRLFNLHIHDIQPDTWDEHKPLIHGFVDYPRLLASLRKVNYDGCLVFEIGGPGDQIVNNLRTAKAKLEAWMRNG